MKPEGCQSLQSSIPHPPNSACPELGLSKRVLQQNRSEQDFLNGSSRAVNGSFQSVRDLVEAIDAYLAHHNLRAKRYLWRADGAEVLRKINRAWQAATC